MNQDQETVHRELELWNSTGWDHDAINSHYTFSPAWNKLFDTDCAAYEDLERRRVACGATRLSWQQKIEDAHDRLAQSRDKYYEPMNERLWGLCPLGVQMRRHLQKPYSDTERRLSWKTLLQDLEECRQLYLSDEFRSSLSPTQRFSFEVLEAWWTAAHCEPTLPRAARRWIEQQLDQEYLDNPTLGVGVDDVCANATQAQTFLSLYHSSCFRLLLVEFHPRAWEPYMSHKTLHQLQTRRFDASVQATVQQAAYGVLHPRPPGPEPSHTYPELILNDMLLNNDLSKAPKPFYLWNTSARHTVVTSSLQIFPSYVCISHTWGRWRRSTSANVPGVPWLVPENTLYDVCDLPEQLAQLGFEYIWFDLFCIPQDESERAQLEIANQAAIFKSSQRCLAWINDVEAWDVVEYALDWMCLKYLKMTSRLDRAKADGLLQKVADAAHSPISLMRATEMNCVTGEPSTWFSSLWTLQECVLCPDIELYSKHWRRLNDRRGAALPLRPLMVLIREAGYYLWLNSPISTPLNTPDEYRSAIRRQPAARDGLRSYEAFLADNRFKHPPSNTDWFVPLAVYRLFQLCSLTRLDNVLTVGMPTSVLLNANVRQSTDNRAPAIMSALGTTDWYRRGISEKKKWSRLICGLYPHEFVQEAAEAFGAPFYECSTGDPVISFRNVFFRKSSLGTMLPFTNRQGWFSGLVGPPPHPKIDIRDHESVSTWRIAPDGSVLISSAGIAITSGDRPQQPLDGYLRWTVPTTKTFRVSTASGGTYNGKDIHAKLAELAGKNTVYAIALYEDCHVQHGILLQKLPYRMLGVQYLVRMGEYFFGYTSLPPSTAVSWRVL